MAGYNELIKNFERVRAYMRDFYVYGFKTRDEYGQKSLRSYDDERRRIESWMPEYTRFVRNREGKITFISINSRTQEHNPLFKAWKSKSFTDKDITLHFILFDILHSPEISLSLNEILDSIGEYLEGFDEPLSFDESTVRKKLKEYCEEGIIVAERQGKKSLYRRADDCNISIPSNALDFFSETLPCGVIGSFLLDKREPTESPFGFKHHYITGTLDCGVLEALFDAMGQKRYVRLVNHRKGSSVGMVHRLVPLRIFISAQSGRQHLLAYSPRQMRIISLRIDYISNVELCEECFEFDTYRARLDELQGNMWGVSCMPHRKLEHFEFTIYAPFSDKEEIMRLLGEKRCGRIDTVEGKNLRFSAEVYDASELIPWARTFISRIIDFKCSNRAVENCFLLDIEKMKRLYGIGGDEK